LTTIVSHSILLASIIVFLCVFSLPNPVSRTDIVHSYVVLIELEERGIGSILVYKSSSDKEF
jgi:hypothetical protein